MIVDPDFLDHWRTRMAVDLLDGDEMASVYILRLWAHCQVRKSDRFEIPTAGLKAQCRYKGDAQKFEDALSEAGFIKREGTEIHVLGWAEQNASLIAAWENGSRGGRPKKPTQNPDETHGLVSHNPSATQPEPIRVDKSREDKKREDKKREEPKAKTSAAPKRKPVKTPLPDGFSISDTVRQWAVAKGYQRIEDHFDSFVRKARANGYAYADWDQALQNAIADDWAKLNGQPRASPGPPSPLGKAGQATAAAAQRLLEKERQKHEQTG